MSRIAAFILVLAALFRPGHLDLTRSLEPGLAPLERSTQGRLVVFETFMQPGCNACTVAGPAINQLAQDYAGQPVIFLEQNISALFGDRYSRWWAANPGLPSAFPPLSMVDSGQATSNGSLDYYQVFQGQIEAARSRPPLAALEAYQARNEDSLKLSIKMTNQSGVALSLVNGAALHALVFDQAHPGYTRTTVRAATSVLISDLLPGSDGLYNLEIPVPPTADWDTLQALILADYRPAGSFGAYAILQAALAQPRRLSVQPETLSILVGLAGPETLTVPLQLSAPPDLNWTASANFSGVGILPQAGSGITQPVVVIQKSLLAPGWQPAVITFSAAGEPLTAQVKLNLYYGAVTHLYLPVIGR